MKWTIAILLSAMVAAVVSQPVQAARIDPNKDTTIRGSTNYNASPPFGLFVKNSSDVSYLEFDLGLASVTEAKLMLHNDDDEVTALWDVVVNNALSANSAVPEPGAMLLALFGGAWLIRVRRPV